MPRRNSGPQKTIVKSVKRTRLQKQEDRNKELGLPPPNGVLLNQQPNAAQSLNDFLDQLQDSVPSTSKRRRRGDLSEVAPSVEDCLDHIPDHQARKYLQKYGDIFD